MGVHHPPLILIVYTANLVLLPAEVYDGALHRFQNFFDTVANNDRKKGDIYRGILREEVAKEQRTFDTMKEEFSDTRNRKFRKKKGFFGKMKASESIFAVKRETSNIGVSDMDVDNVTYTFPEIRTQDAFQPTLKLLQSQKKHYDRAVRIYDKMKKLVSDDEDRKGKLEVGMNDINGTLIMLESVIDSDTETVNRMNHGQQDLDDDDRKIPWRDASSSIALYHWKMIKKYAGEVPGDEELKKQCVALMQVAALGVYEVSEYKKYVKTVLPVFTAPTPREIFVTNGTGTPPMGWQTMGWLTTGRNA